MRKGELAVRPILLTSRTGSTQFERDIRQVANLHGMKFDSGGIFRLYDQKEIFVERCAPLPFASAYLLTSHTAKRISSSFSSWIISLPNGVIAIELRPRCSSFRFVGVHRYLWSHLFVIPRTPLLSTCTPIAEIHQKRESVASSTERTP